MFHDNACRQFGCRRGLAYACWAYQCEYPALIQQVTFVINRVEIFLQHRLCPIQCALLMLCLFLVLRQVLCNLTSQTGTETCTQ